MQPAASVITGRRRVTKAEHLTSGFCSRSLVHIKSSLTGDENDYVFHYSGAIRLFRTRPRWIKCSVMKRSPSGITHDLRPIRPPRRFCKARSCGVSGSAQSSGAGRQSVSLQDDGRRAEPATALRQIVPRVGAGARPNPSMMARILRCARLPRKEKPWLVESLFPSQPLLWAFLALQPMPQQLASSKLRKTSSLSLT